MLVQNGCLGGAIMRLLDVSMFSPSFVAIYDCLLLDILDARVYNFLMLRCLDDSSDEQEKRMSESLVELMIFVAYLL